MNEYTKLFERASERFEAPDLPLEGMLRRRDRLRRNSRLAAGVVGIVVALAAILIGTSVIRPNAHGPAPAKTPTMHNGDITFMVQGGLAGISPEGERTDLLPGCCNPPGGWIQGADWSPDGTRFAYGIYSREPKGIPVGVYVLDEATGESSRVTDGPVQSIDWSPDGSKIAFSDFSTINLMDADGSDRTTLWAGPGWAADPSWSPDGTQVAFSVYAMPGSGKDTEGVHVIDVVGSADGVITEATDGPLSAPAWSPDGSKIAYIDRCNIRLMSPDGSSGVLLRHIDDCPDRGLSGPGDAAFSDAAQLVWSPDGTQIAFNLWRVDDTFPLYVMRADGTELTKLAVPRNATPPVAWQPVP